MNPEKIIFTRLSSLISFLLLFLYLHSSLLGQNIGELHGNFYTVFQYYNDDNAINTINVPEKLLMNGYANLDYRINGFSAGIRYETYIDPLLGYDPRYKGSGIPYKYINYAYKKLSITAGNFYEQFGSGMIFRSYEDKELGYDNCMDGFRIRFEPFDGIILKGIIGKQRSFWSEGNGIVRGLDAEFNINEITSGKNNKLSTIIGGSVVSKYETDNNPTYKLPENVAAFAGRLMMNYSKLHFEGEYVYKYNDPYPSIFDKYNYIYKPGQALLLTGSYNQKGLGILLSAKRIDNMNFHSQNNATVNNLMINYLPPLTIQHEYMLQNYFPYATQPNGEMGIQGQIIYTFKKGSPVGGTYGTEIMLNYSRIQSINQQLLPDSTHMGYKSDFFRIGNKVYYEDGGIALNKKINSKVKLAAAFTNFIYNNDIINGFEWNGIIYGNVGVGDLTYKLSDKNAIRIELQHLYSKEYKKSWALALLEYSVSPHWSFTVYDEYNYGNSVISERLHFYNASFRYEKNGKSIQMMYGRRVEGVVCIGGVCRYMPASDGLTAIISCSF
jgi:hypothetical protein